MASVLNQNIKNSLIRISASYIELELKTLYIYLYKHSVVYVLFLTVFESLEKHVSWAPIETPSKKETLNGFRRPYH